MNTDTLYQNADNSLDLGRKWLVDRLNRSDALRKTALLLVHVSGTALMLSAPLTLAMAATGAIYLYSGINGPLDWFFVEILSTLALASAFLSWQLVMLRVEDTDGMEISQEQAPELFTMLQRRASHFKMKAVSRLVLTPGTSLKITATPVLPVPLLHRYTLNTGLPTLFFMSHGQFRLALAGAVAASAKNQSSIEGWLTQACEDWSPIIKALENQQTLLSRLLLKPMRKIARASNHLGQQTMNDWRQQQGRWVRENSDEQTLIDCLANQVVTEAFLEKQYWPMILKAAERSPTPVVKAFSHLPVLLEKILNKDLAERWVLQAQATADKNQNSLRDLLAELQIEHLFWSGLPDKNAFESLFSSSSILKQMDAYWQNEIEPEWRERHAKYQADRARFEHLQLRATEQGLRGESALRYIKLADRFLDKKDALTVYQGMYTSNQDDARVCFASGLAMLRSGDVARGSDALQRAAVLDRSLTSRAHALINKHRNAWLSERNDQADNLTQAATA